MMLIEHYAVEVQQLLVCVDLLVDVLVEDLRTVLGLEEAVRGAVEAALLDDLVFEPAIFLVSTSGS